MKTLWKLFLGEMRRMVSYKILPVSLFTSLLWIIAFLFLSKLEALQIAPLLIFMDVSMMSILLIGAAHHLERTEGTVKSMMVMPVSIGQIVISKVMASIALGLESAVVTSAALYFIHGLTLNYGLLFLAILVAGAAHGAIGFSLALLSRDFSSMLGILMLYIVAFAAPSILLTLKVIPASYEWLVLLSPSHAAQILINAGVAGNGQTGKLIFSYGYLAALTGLLLSLHVYPGFKRHAVRG